VDPVQLEEDIEVAKALDSDPTFEEYSELMNKHMNDRGMREFRKLN